MKFHRILVGLDMSELSQMVFARSLALAQASQANLHLFHCLLIETIPEPTVPVIPAGLPDLGNFPGYGDSAYLHQQTEDQVQQAIAFLQEYHNKAQSQNVRSEFSHQMGEPGRSICRVAQEWSADLIVMGRRGRSGLAEMLLGSVSNYVIHHASCSVLVVQASESVTTTGSPPA